eukprot:14855829-Alexandrium_andersonii.AAC.1
MGSLHAPSLPPADATRARLPARAVLIPGAQGLCPCLARSGGLLGGQLLRARVAVPGGQLPSR